MSQAAVSLMSMREARDSYFKANGFSADAYSASTFTLKLPGIPFTFLTAFGMLLHISVVLML